MVRIKVMLMMTAMMRMRMAMMMMVVVAMEDLRAKVEESEYCFYRNLLENPFPSPTANLSTQKWTIMMIMMMMALVMLMMTIPDQPSCYKYDQHNLASLSAFQVWIIVSQPFVSLLGVGGGPQ